MNHRNIYEEIKKIDYELKVKGFLIYQRHFQALREFQIKFNISFENNPDIAKKINEWYTLLYGDNLNIQISKKNYLIKIKGDIFALGVPLIFGSTSVFWGRGDIKPRNTISSGTVEIDARTLIDYITPLYSEMMYENTIDINQTIEWTKKVINIDIYFKNKINEKSDNMYNIIYNDLISAKEHFMIKSYDMTEWQCLQVAEKLLKIYIKKHKNIEPKHTHILSKLNMVAQINDPVILKLMPLLETDPSYRYENKSSRDKAFKKYESVINFIESFINIL